MTSARARHFCRIACSYRLAAASSLLRYVLLPCLYSVNSAIGQWQQEANLPLDHLEGDHGTIWPRTVHELDGPVADQNALDFHFGFLAADLRFFSKPAQNLSLLTWRRGQVLNFRRGRLFYDQSFCLRQTLVFGNLGQNIVYLGFVPGGEQAIQIGRFY